MYNDVLYLIAESRTVDEYGDPVVTETKRPVFCKVGSIGQKEFYQAHAVGLQPEIKFVISDYYDYNGEKRLEYNGVNYSVLRTYRDGKTLDIVCYKEVN